VIFTPSFVRSVRIFAGFQRNKRLGIRCRIQSPILEIEDGAFSF
jgi:hypothetical protein